MTKAKIKDTFKEIMTTDEVVKLQNYALGFGERRRIREFRKQYKQMAAVFGGEDNIPLIELLRVCRSADIFRELLLDLKTELDFEEMCGNA